MAVIFEHFTQLMDAPDVLWSNNHLLYYVVNTEPEQLVTHRIKYSQGKHHFSSEEFTCNSASSILNITCTCVDTVSI